ncbi:hypothetical protein BJX66DRAFT_341010 [Aspergillus keveii]|uniref:An04g07800 n=1 Tax=Aspergillus keveii TaxID=714993 RepID=A0ABR4FWT1_9EURO
MPSITAKRPEGSDGLAVEAWGQGLMVGSLIVMIAVTVANMKMNVLLHKLIAAELILAIAHGTFIFIQLPTYGWYLSITAIGLNASWSLHNLIAWLKVRPFLRKKPWIGKIYLISLFAAQPYWIVEIYANFAFFNQGHMLFLRTRPLEPLFRDPWWIFTSCYLVRRIQLAYSRSWWGIVRDSPRFGAMIFFMALSICFTIVDTCAVSGTFHLNLHLGIEPFWKLAFVFKCLSDIIILDDFKSALDRVRRRIDPQDIELHSTDAGGLPDRPLVQRPTPVLERSGWYFYDTRGRRGLDR